MLNLKNFLKSLLKLFLPQEEKSDNKDKNTLVIETHKYF